jgi:hypothetical protein
MLNRLQFIDSAASKYSIFLILIIEALKIRTYAGIVEIEIAKIHLSNPVPNTAEITMDISIPGMAERTSINLIIRLSTIPPKKPAIDPRINPNITDNVTEARPIDKENLVPYIILDKISLPN